MEEGGIAEGAMAGAGAEVGGAAVVRGPELYGVNPGPPGFGPGEPMELPPDGLACWAQTGAENASAATTATLVKRWCFMSAILSFGPQLDMVDDWGSCHLVEVFSLSFKWYSQGFVESPPPSSTAARRRRCCLLRLNP